MTITISMTQVLRGVYADASLMSASVDGAQRPALLRREHEKALKRAVRSVWGALMVELGDAVGSFDFSPTGALPELDPELLSVELTGSRAEANGAGLRLQLETALERRLLALAYRETWPEASRACEQMAERAVAGFKGMSGMEEVWIRGWL